ncbi:MAG: hypothetical protein A2V45_04685 [Candidatus Aminicenantes bacterium RBG_19FT_COMBO_58_17]|nr:MAG: hypothetical protein A2V45_04685 [Candidatus Aminicenantes bacterium RBG_19FT_COMBO_58_17]
MKETRISLSLLSWLILMLAGSIQARADINRRWGRVSLFALAAQRSQPGGENNLFTELVGTLMFRSSVGEDGGFEYAIDSRFAGYPSTEGRSQRVSIFDAHVGWWTKSRTFGFRAGQVWLDALGALGSLGGVVAEVRPFRNLPLGIGEMRLGGFWGFEPKIMEAGYVSNVNKFGGYLAIEGAAARRHVLGYVNIRNQGLTERSVLVFSNYLPIKRAFYLYQAMEYDLQGPAGQGQGRLTYFFANARYSPLRLIELQGIYHHGRSIDARTITEQVRSGRPVSESALEGFLFESIGGRLTLRFFPGLQVFAGYAQDKTNEQDEKRDRLTFGFFGYNLFKTGLDLRVTNSRFSQAGRSSYNSWYVSLGKTLGRSLYLEGFFSSSVSILRYFGSQVQLETRPRTELFGLSSIFYLTRRASLLLTIERTSGDFPGETRAMTGVSYRF